VARCRWCEQSSIIDTPTPTLATARLLIVEDDDRTARLLARALLGDGYAVDVAKTGDEGYAAALSSDFDLILLDLMLPGMDGTVLLSRLMEQRPQQRIIVLSAVPEIGTRVACLEAGAADFLAKPFALAELRARVRARIRSQAPGPVVDEIVVGPIHLNLRLHQVEIPGRRPATLSYREFLLLRHLMQRAGRPCTRPELLQDVWGLGFDPGTNVVDVCVRRLRAKLDHTDRIETVRHVGYRFSAD
jgi:two-component system OmpR family response regulator